MAQDLGNWMSPVVTGFTDRHGNFIMKPGGVPEPGDPFWTIHAFTIAVPMIMEMSAFEEGINYDVLLESEVSHTMGLSRSEARIAIAIAQTPASDAHLLVAYKPRLTIGHNKIGVRIDGETQWFDLIPDEAQSVLRENEAVQSAQLTFGNRPAWIRHEGRISTNYQIKSMPITRSEALSVEAAARGVSDVPGKYQIMRNSCTTFARGLMRAAGKQPAPWGRSPSLFFWSVP